MSIHAFVLASALFGPLAPGPHPVGFRLVMEVDVTRPALPPSTNAMGRQIPIAVWYPAAPGAGASMRVRDYVVLNDEALTSVAPSDPEAAVETFIAGALARGLP